MYQLIDFLTRKTVTAEGLVFTGNDTPWVIDMDFDSIKEKLNLNNFITTPSCLAKYLPFMPIKQVADFISLTEVATPLVKSKSITKKLNINLYFKVEARNPTGSFKDRGSAVDIAVAKEYGAKAVILASTGNMAASCACYAAAAKIPCFVLVPEGTPLTKLAQVMAFGGHIIQVKGDYNAAAVLAKEIALERNFFLAGDYAYRVEGQKTAAYEIVDQLFFNVPDVVIIPMGCGTNITAYAKGFAEYQQLGLIDKVPQLIGVQATGAAAIVNSYEQKSNSLTPLKSINTIASAIAVADPIDGMKALDAIYSSKGCAIAVTDQEILEAQYLLATEENLFVETASAATVAALLKLDGYADKKIVCVLTGDGLKDANVMLAHANPLVSISPEKNEFFALYEKQWGM